MTQYDIAPSANTTILLHAISDSPICVQQSRLRSVMLFNHVTVPFLGDSPSGEQPEQRKLAQTSQQPAGGCRVIFHKYCCYTK